MASSIPKIEHFDDLLRSYIGQNAKIVSYETKLLNAPGDNYGSCMVAIDIVVKNGEKSAYTLHTVAKLCPLNEWLKRMFASQITFKKEIGFYMDLVPTLIQFQKEHNVAEENLLNIFPECINARINLNPNSDNVDDNAVLLLENLKTKGYKLLNRLNGFNLEETKLVLKDLARYHATPLAYKIQKPNDFKVKILPLLNRVCIGEEMFEKAKDKFNESIARHLNLSDSELSRFEEGMNRGHAFQKNFPTGDEEYATMVHCDFWLNNTMIQYMDDKPVHNKMIDFQVSTYGSLATDVVFFLYTSVNQAVIEKYYDHFLKIYHEAFLACLQELHCDTSAYSFNSFLKQINQYGPLEASHILIMFKAIFQVSDKAHTDDMNMDDMFSDEGITEIYKNRLSFTVKEFFNKNWF